MLPFVGYKGGFDESEIKRDLWGQTIVREGRTRKCTAKLASEWLYPALIESKETEGLFIRPGLGAQRWVPWKNRPPSHEAT